MLRRAYEKVSFARRGRVLTMTLDRPDALNAVDETLHTELSTLFYDAAVDPGSDVLVLTGAGRCFSAGGDIALMRANHGNPAYFARGAVESKAMIFGLLDCQKPIIAKLNGHAMGLGATLALFCDVIFAHEEAKIGDPHVSVGLAAGDGGAVIWPQLIGYARAKHHLMTGEPMSAKEAERIGLINAALPADQLDAAVDAYADRLANGATMAIAYTKTTVNIGLKQLAHAIMDAGLGYEAVTAAQPAHGEAIDAFAAKRRPVFSPPAGIIGKGS
jgi:enoyl-CoA hydratase